MAKLTDVLDKVSKVSENLEAYLASHQTSKEADLEQISAALDVVLSKLVTRA